MEALLLNTIRGRKNYTKLFEAVLEFLKVNAIAKSTTKQNITSYFRCDLTNESMYPTFKDHIEINHSIAYTVVGDGSSYSESEEEEEEEDTLDDNILDPTSTPLELMLEEIKDKDNFDELFEAILEYLKVDALSKSTVEHNYNAYYKCNMRDRSFHPTFSDNAELNAQIFYAHPR